jgi:hypothetical protein
MQLNMLQFYQSMKNQEGVAFNREHDNAYQETIDAPTEDQLMMLRGQGKTVRPNRRFPNRYDVVPMGGGGLGDGGGGYGEMPQGPGPDPNSPLGQDPAFRDGGAGSAALRPPPPSMPKPGEDPLDYVQRRRDEKTGSTARAKEIAKLGVKRQETQPVLDYLDEMLKATDVLPSVDDMGAAASVYSGVSGARNWLTLRTETTGPRAEKLRLLRAGDILKQKLYRLDAVGVATEQDVKPYIQRLENNIWKGREGAYNSIKELRDYLKTRMDAAQSMIDAEHPDPYGTTSTTTTPSTSTTSTTQPGGVISAEDFLAQ